MAKSRTDLIAKALFACFVLGFVVAMVGVALFDYRLALVLTGAGISTFALTVDVED